MLCALDESPFELSWLALQAKEEADAEVNSRVSMSASGHSNTHVYRGGAKMSGTLGGILPIRHFQRYLSKQSLVIKTRARQQLGKTLSGDGQTFGPRYLKYLHARLFLVYFLRSLLQHIVSFVILTRAWLFVFIFLICAIEHDRMAPVDPNITVFKVIFEIISAFGSAGLTLGYPNVSSSFATVLSPASKTIFVITMLMGRHRGLLASMKDQETIEYSARELIDGKREEIIQQHRKESRHTSFSDQRMPEENVTRF